MKHYDESMIPDTSEDRATRQRVAFAEEVEKRRRLKAGAKLFGWGSEVQYSYFSGDDHVTVKYEKKNLELPIGMINLYDSRWYVREIA